MAYQLDGQIFEGISFPKIKLTVFIFLSIDQALEAGKIEAVLQGKLMFVIQRENTAVEF